MASDGADGARVRTAEPEDHVAVTRVLDGALLDVSGLRDRLADGTVLVALVDGCEEDAIVGAVVIAPEGPAERSPPADWPQAAHVRSIAVRRKRRRRGIGTTLLRAARKRWVPLVADFDAHVGPFYEALGAECRVADDGRHWALLREPWFDRPLVS